jgi:hypothetical protein
MMRVLAHAHARFPPLAGEGGEGAPLAQCLGLPPPGLPRKRGRGASAAELGHAD